ncbi:MAG: transcriptional activator NhaR [Fimbriiglobus sp.]|nr:transcriptional activator NhaR [Fimbriiglobus sp.]
MAKFDALNYHHLRYFWLMAREGGVSAAASVAEVGQPVVSAQIRRLEHFFGMKLIEKDGRNVKLTDLGRVVYEYADDIFRLGGEMLAAVRDGKTHSRLARVTVGVADVVPKLVVYKLLEPLYSLPDPVQLVVVEARPEKLLTDLASHTIDLVLTDSPVVGGPKVKVYTHTLGECGVTVFAAETLATRLRKGFPKSLHRMPFLLPTSDSSMRRSLDQWFDENGVQPDIRGEFADSALLKVFGQAGRGVFALPSVVEEEIRSQYGVMTVGRAQGLKVRFNAITAERRITHPAIIAIRETARLELFSEK